MTPETEKMIAEIEKHCGALITICKKLRNRNKDANHCSYLAMMAINTGKDWAIEAVKSDAGSAEAMESDILLIRLWVPTTAVGAKVDDPPNYGEYSSYDPRD